MAYEVPGFVYSCMSEGDIEQFRGVVVNANGAVARAGADAAIDGVAQMPAATASPETIRVMQTGITYGEAGAAVRRGYYVRIDVQGRIIEVADNNAPANQVGKSLTAAGAAGELIAVLLY